MKNKNNTFLKKALEYLNLYSTVNTKLSAYETVAGETISVDDEDGKTEFTDGEYALLDGSTLVITEGVAKVKEAEAVVEEALADEATVEVEVEVVADEKDTKIAELEAKVSELEAELEASKVQETALSKVTKDLEAAISKLENTPATESVNLSKQKEKKPLTKAEIHFARFKAENNIK